MPDTDPSIVASSPGSVVFGQSREGPISMFVRRALEMPNASLDLLLGSVKKFLGEDTPDQDFSPGARLAASKAGGAPTPTGGTTGGTTPTTMSGPGVFSQALGALGLLGRGAQTVSRFAQRSGTGTGTDTATPSEAARLGDLSAGAQEPVLTVDPQVQQMMELGDLNAAAHEPIGDINVTTPGSSGGLLPPGTGEGVGGAINLASGIATRDPKAISTGALQTGLGVAQSGVLGEGAASAAGTAAPYVGAAVSGAQDIMSNKPNYEKGVDTALDVAAAALAPATYGISLAALPIVKEDARRSLGALASGNLKETALVDANPGAIPITIPLDLVHMFGGPDIISNIFGNQPSIYDLRRKAAQKEANASVQALGGPYSQATDAASLYQALQAAAGDRGSVRSFLNVPGADAANLGLPAGVNEWGSMTPAQFQSVFDFMAADPSRLSDVGGSGDVAYLKASKAAAVGEQAANEARAAIQRVIAAMPRPAPAPSPTTSMASDAVRLGAHDDLARAIEDAKAFV